MLRFFGVSNRVAWQDRWLQPQASLRASAAFKPKPEAVATWLRWGEVEAANIDCAPFDASGLRALIPEIRSLTIVAPVSHALDHLEDLCKGVGVAVTLIPELPGAPLSGAARWLAPNCALIQLSLRHKRAADFWFTFFHEIDYVLTSRGRQDIIDTIDVPTELDEEETHANAFAREVLIPLRPTSHSSPKRNSRPPPLGTTPANSGSRPGSSSAPSSTTGTSRRRASTVSSARWAGRSPRCAASKPEALSPL